jgi:hypothetical protein
MATMLFLVIVPVIRKRLEKHASISDEISGEYYYC